MATSTHARVSPGTPRGGRFAARTHAEADIEITPGQLDIWQCIAIAEGRPVPEPTPPPHPAAQPARRHTRESEPDAVVIHDGQTALAIPDDRPSTPRSAA